jgi:hypothetical protein
VKNKKVILYTSLIGLIILSIGPNYAVIAQNDSSYIDFGDFGGIIYLDSVMVMATREGLEVEDFIRYVQEDTSFYQAFRNIRTRSYRADNDIRLFNKKARQIAHYACRSIQTSDGRCSEMVREKEQIEGNYYKKKRKGKELKYYTAKLYHKLFLIEHPFCYDPKEITPDEAPKGMAKHISELKKLIFSPGQKADVPLIGNKTAIFDAQMARYYDFHFTGGQYQNKWDCYIFSAFVKPKYQEKKENKTVIKSLSTYFDRETFQVLGRSYQLTYEGLLYSFDITMEIELTKKGNDYLPKYLSYDGYWDIAFKKPEIAKFNARFYY